MLNTLLDSEYEEKYQFLTRSHPLTKLYEHPEKFHVDELVNILWESKTVRERGDITEG